MRFFGYMCSSPNDQLNSVFTSVAFSLIFRNARPRAVRSFVSSAEPNSAIAALRSDVVGVTPAFVNNWSTNDDGDSVVGYAPVNLVRCTNSAVNADLLFSKTVSHPDAPTTTP